MNDSSKQINKILNMYNIISEKEISYEDFSSIFPKISIILKKFSLDNVELIELVDTLLEFRKYGQLDKINEQSLKLIKKITINNELLLEGNLYFSLVLKDILMPYNLNKCNNGYDTLLYISEFEILLELINEKYSKEDLVLLQIYNKELFDLLLQYKKSSLLYKEKIHEEIILNTVISHLFAIFYFNQENYDYNYEMIEQVVDNSINNYQEFINYCYNEEICDNFSKVVLEKGELQKEYEISKKMLDYTFENIKKKRKC